MSQLALSTTLFGFVFLIVLIGIGLWASKKVTGEGELDFSLGGRSVPWYLIAGSVVSTWIAPGAMVSYVGLGYDVGLAGYWSGGAFMIMSVWVGWWIIPRLRRLNVATVPEIFGKLYGPKHRMFSFALVLGRDLGMCADVVITMAIMFTFIYGFGTVTSLIITSAIVIIYTWMGGAWAVMASDFLQSILVLIGTTVAIPIMIVKLGGLAATKGAMADNLTNIMDVGISQSAAWFITALLITCAYQTMLQRGLAAKSDYEARKGFAVGGLILTFWFIVPFVIGAIGTILYPGSVDPNNIYLAFLNDAFGSILGAIFYICLLAAAMGTVDSLIVTMSSNVSHDIYKNFFNRTATPKQMIKVERISIIGITFIAALIGYVYPMLLELCWIGGRFMAATLAPVILGIVFFPQVRRCKITTMTVFTVVSIVMLWAHLQPAETVATTRVWALDPILQGAPVAFVILIIGTIIETKFINMEQQKLSV